MPELVIKIPKLGKKLEKELAKGIEIFTRAEIARLLMLKKLDKMLAKSKLTEAECIKLGRLVKKGRFEELRKMGLV